MKDEEMRAPIARGRSEMREAADLRNTKDDLRGYFLFITPIQFK